MEKSHKKGKKSQTAWVIIAKKLEEEGKQLGFTVTGRSFQKVKEKFFNLVRRYKACKDKLKTSGEDSKEIDICPYFDLFR